MIAEKLYFKPNTVAEAIALAKENGEKFRFIAGGTDVLVNKFQGNNNSACLIDLTGIDELKQVKKVGEYLSIGALVRLDELKKIEYIRNEFPVLIDAAHSVASPVIRKTATIGGNILCENRCIFYNQSEWWREAAGRCLKCDGDICIASGGKKKCFSKFVSDTAPTLISMDSIIEVIDKDDERKIKIEDIYTGDGIEPRSLSKTAIVKSVLLPLNQQFQSVFKKLRQRESLDFTSLTTCVSIDKNGKIKIVLGGIDTKPIVIVGTTKSNREELITQAFKKSRAIDNEIFSRNYRREMVKVFLRRSFDELIRN